MEANVGAVTWDLMPLDGRSESLGGGPPCFLPLARTGEHAATARRALILVHGRRRNAGAYIDFAARAFLPVVPGLAIVAPQFPTAGDRVALAWANCARWSEIGWIAGGACEPPHRITAFAALDALLDHLADPVRFPFLEDIVLAGHSAGGQLVHRYAVLAPDIDLRVRFVVANPSSYVIFGGDAFAWKYGLAGRPRYGASADDATVEARYVRRDVLYLLGAADNDAQHPALDRSQAALAQGPHRLDRGRNYRHHLDSRHGTAMRHRWVEIAEVGHDAEALFTRPQSIRALWPGCHDDTQQHEETPS